MRLKTRLFNRDADDAQIEVLINDHGETNRDHNHEPDDEIIEHVEFVNEAKAAILVDPTKPNAYMTNMLRVLIEMCKEVAIGLRGSRISDVFVYTDGKEDITDNAWYSA